MPASMQKSRVGGTRQLEIDAKCAEHIEVHKGGERGIVGYGNRGTITNCGIGESPPLLFYDCEIIHNP